MLSTPAKRRAPDPERTDSTASKPPAASGKGYVQQAKRWIKRHSYCPRCLEVDQAGTCLPNCPHDIDNEGTGCGAWRCSIFLRHKNFNCHCGPAAPFAKRAPQESELRLRGGAPRALPADSEPADIRSVKLEEPGGSAPPNNRQQPSPPQIGRALPTMSMVKRPVPALEPIPAAAPWLQRAARARSPQPMTAAAARKAAARQAAERLAADDRTRPTRCAPMNQSASARW